MSLPKAISKSIPGRSFTKGDSDIEFPSAFIFALRTAGSWVESCIRILFTAFAHSDSTFVLLSLIILQKRKKKSLSTVYLWATETSVQERLVTRIKTQIEIYFRSATIVHSFEEVKYEGCCCCCLLTSPPPTVGVIKQIMCILRLYRICGILLHRARGGRRKNLRLKTEVHRSLQFGSFCFALRFRRTSSS